MVSVQKMSQKGLQYYYLIVCVAVILLPIVSISLFTAIRTTSPIVLSLLSSISYVFYLFLIFFAFQAVLKMSKTNLGIVPVKNRLYLVALGFGGIEFALGVLEFAVILPAIYGTSFINESWISSTIISVLSSGFGIFQ